VAGGGEEASRAWAGNRAAETAPICTSLEEGSLLAHMVQAHVAQVQQGNAEQFLFQNACSLSLTLARWAYTQRLRRRFPRARSPPPIPSLCSQQHGRRPPLPAGLNGLKVGWTLPSSC
jgi:hypothetical protein